MKMKMGARAKDTYKVNNPVLTEGQARAALDDMKLKNTSQRRHAHQKKFGK